MDVHPGQWATSSTPGVKKGLEASVLPHTYLVYGLVDPKYSQYKGMSAELSIGQ